MIVRTSLSVNKCLKSFMEMGGMRTRSGQRPYRIRKPSTAAQNLYQFLSCPLGIAESYREAVRPKQPYRSEQNGIRPFGQRVRVFTYASRKDEPVPPAQD